MSDLLIDGGTVITMDPKRRVIKNGAVAIEGNRIAAVGKSEDVRKDHGSDEIIKAQDKVILPGFVNTHTHLFQVLFRSLADDMDLFNWARVIYRGSAANLTPQNCYAAAMMGCLELIKSGVSCTVDNHCPFPRQGIDDSIMEAFLRIGMRGIEARGAMDVDSMNILGPEIVTTPERGLMDTISFMERWHGKNGGMTRVMFGTGAPFVCSMEMLRKVREAEDRYGLGIVIHLAETRGEYDEYMTKYGKTSIQYVEDAGLLGPSVIAIHSVWLSERDIELFKIHHVKVSHNPLSNMYLSSGVAPISRLVKEGLLVTLGVDGAASNNNQDMIETIKTAALLQKVSTLDPLSITAEQVLEMATINGAEAVGLGKELGSLEAGKLADISIINLKSPSIVPVNRVPSQIVYCAKSGDVDTLIINGKVVMKERKMMSVDEDAIMVEAQKAADDLIDKAGKNELRDRAWRT